jgi:hypothetical protein
MAETPRPASSDRKGPSSPQVRSEQSRQSDQPSPTLNFRVDLRLALFQLVRAEKERR